MAPVVNAGAETIRGGGWETESAAHDGVSWLQIQTKKEEEEVSFTRDTGGGSGW